MDVGAPLRHKGSVPVNGGCAGALTHVSCRNAPSQVPSQGAACSCSSQCRSMAPGRRAGVAGETRLCVRSPPEQPSPLVPSVCALVQGSRGPPRAPHPMTLHAGLSLVSAPERDADGPGDSHSHKLTRCGQSLSEVAELG